MIAEEKQLFVYKNDYLSKDIVASWYSNIVQVHLIADNQQFKIENK